MMKIFSFFKKEEVLRCDYCKAEIDVPVYTKTFGNTKYCFCSESCKQSFRKWVKQAKYCGPSCGCK